MERAPLAGNLAFDLVVGVDYSGAKTADTHLPGLQVFKATPGQEPKSVASASVKSARRYWTRREVAEYLFDLVSGGQRVLVGIDHAFSFPEFYYKQFQLRSWDEFLRDFIKQFPLHEPGVGNPGKNVRVGDDKRKAFRLCENWTSSAKGVFEFGIPGQVAASTHTGIPWLHYLRTRCKGHVHFWPFDGWNPLGGNSLVVEVYPSILRNRFDFEGRTIDEQDAYAVTRWLGCLVERGDLVRYLDPPLTKAERKRAMLEGWILGIG